MEKKINVMRHFFMIGSATFFNMFLGLLTTPVITRIVDPGEYGQFSIFTMYSSIAVMVLSLGLDQSLIRYYYEKEDIGYKRALLFRCVLLPVIISSFVSFFFILFISCGIVKFEFTRLITVFLCIYTIMQILYRFSILLVRLAYKSKIYSFLNVIHKIIYIVIVVPLILWFSDDYFLMLVLATILASLVCLVISVIVQINVWNIFRYDAEMCHIGYSDIYKYGFPYILSMGITTLFQAIDKISLNRYCSYTEVGIYASTMTLVNIFAIVQSTFNALWAPMAIEHYAQNPRDKEFYQKANQIMTVIMFLFGITLIGTKDVWVIFLGPKYREAACILPFLIFQPIMYTISETTVIGINFMKKSNMHIIIASIACISNMVGNIVLVPMYGCKGAAISTGLSYIILYYVRTIIANKYYAINFMIKKFTIMTGIVIIFSGINTFTENIVINLVLYCLCILVLLVLYNEVVIWGMKYTLSSLRRFIKRWE